MDVETLKSLLIKHEGFRKYPYVDTVGKVTIGVGHNLTDNGLSSVQVLNLLEDDIAATVAFLDAECPWFKDLDGVRQIAIADMAFNLRERLLQFKNTIAALERKDWDAAANGIESSLFAKQVGKRAQDIAQMIRTGELV